jgi:hypothetical protein
MNKESKYYYRDGTTSSEYDSGKALHRVDGPAVEHANGTKEWYVDGKLYRLDGPAVEFVDGTKAWWIDGKRHRIDGPAVKFADGSKHWYVNHKLHRLDGPAVEWTGGYRVWYIDDTKHTKQDFDNIIKQTNEMSLAMRLTDPRWWVRELGEREIHEQGK